MIKIAMGISTGSELTRDFSVFYCKTVCVEADDMLIFLYIIVT
jgi:hypothetical protein